MEKLNQIFSRVASSMLLFVFMNFAIGCHHHYKAKTVVPNKVRVKLESGVYQWMTLTAPEQFSYILKMSSERYVIVHQGDSIWHLKDIALDQISSTMRGSFEEVAVQYKPYIELMKKQKTARYEVVNKGDVLVQAHLYVSEYAQEENSVVVFPLSSIKKIDIYEPAVGKTGASYGIPLLAISAAAALAIAFIVFAIAWN